MIAKFISVLLILLSMIAPDLALSIEHESEWIAYGGATLNDEGSSICFYDAKGIKTTPEGTRKVWTKCILDKLLSLDSLPQGIKKQTTEKAAMRLIKGTPPNITKVIELDRDQIINIFAYEEIANTGSVPYQSQMLIDINCSDKSYRQLHFDIVVNGKNNPSEQKTNWEDIPPESNISKLQKLICQ